MAGWQTGQTATGTMRGIGVKQEEMGVMGIAGGKSWCGKGLWATLEDSIHTHLCTHIHRHTHTCAYTGVPQRHLLSAQPAADAQDSCHHLCKSCLGVQVLHVCVHSCTGDVCTHRSTCMCAGVHEFLCGHVWHCVCACRNTPVCASAQVLVCTPVL